MAGIKCIGNIMRSTSRISSQVCPSICRNLSKDISHSRRKLCTIANLNCNADVLNARFVMKPATSKFYSSSPVALIGCLSTINSAILIETTDSSSSDMLECLGSDDDSDTWSLF